MGVQIGAYDDLGYMALVHEKLGKMDHGVRYPIWSRHRGEAEKVVVIPLDRRLFPRAASSPITSAPVYLTLCIVLLRNLRQELSFLRVSVFEGMPRNWCDTSSCTVLEMTTALSTSYPTF